MDSGGDELSRVRIFSLDDSSAVEMPLRLRGRPARDEEPEAAPVPRRREETAVRRHAFLHQTMPPCDPVVRESERRRSGSGSDDETE